MLCAVSIRSIDTIFPSDMVTDTGYIDRLCKSTNWPLMIIFLDLTLLINTDTKKRKEMCPSIKSMNTQVLTLVIECLIAKVRYLNIRLISIS